MKQKQQRSFLKWAGGKSKSLVQISEATRIVKGRFIEPFVGSGVVFLNTFSPSYIIGDTNEDLINLFNIIKNSHKDLILLTKEEFTLDKNTEMYYYENRERFNNSKDPLERAALFIYLNRHCFNGLCRYNRKGIFNVPFGRYKTVHFPEKEIILAVEKLKDCEVYCQGFEDTIALAEEGDVIYCDPPYVPLSMTASFTDYSQGGFTEKEQKRLAELAENSKCKFIISNHDTEFTRELYKNADEIFSREVGRFISASAESRKPVNELLAIYNKNI